MTTQTQGYALVSEEMYAPGQSLYSDQDSFEVTPTRNAIRPRDRSLGCSRLSLRFWTGHQHHRPWAVTAGARPGRKDRLSSS